MAAAKRKASARRGTSAPGGGSGGEALEGDDARQEGEGPTFEVAIGRLEEIVDRLEGGELALEESLAIFEEGVALSRRCAEQLDSAERRIEALAEQGGDWVARPLDGSDDDWDEEDGED